MNPVDPYLRETAIRVVIQDLTGDYVFATNCVPAIGAIAGRGGTSTPVHLPT